MKKLLSLLTVLLFLAAAAPGLSEPLTLTEDLLVEARIELNDQAAYIFSCRYPQVDLSDPSAELINSFYQYEAGYAEKFTIPMNSEYYQTQNPAEDIREETDYRITCNTEDFFGVLVHTSQSGLQTYAGHTFSRKDIKPGSSVALPYLLGLLEGSGHDTWLEDRQTAKADALVREMVWDRLNRMDDVVLMEDLEEEMMEYYFFPEEDFYLDETGNPVFYLQPGFAEDSGRLLLFPITIEEILDEM